MDILCFSGAVCDLVLQFLHPNLVLLRGDAVGGAQAGLAPAGDYWHHCL